MNGPPLLLPVMSLMTGECMSRRRSVLFSTFSAAAIVAVSATAHAQDATSQTAANELPPVIVEGGTLEAKPVAKAKPKAPVVADEPGPEPVQSTKKIKKPAAPTTKASQPGAPAASEPDPAGADAANGAAPTENAEATSIAGISSEKLGTSVSVVTGEQLRAQQIRNGGDAIRSLPGVAVSRTGGVGGLTQVRLRGAEGNHTAVLIDGIEANDTFNGEYNFSDLSTDDIARIEVLRGQQSGIYGSGAIGGVINIVTSSGRGPLTVRTMGEAGSFGTAAGSIGISGGTDKVWGSFNLSERRTKGFNISPSGDEDDGSILKAFSMRGGVQMFPGVTLDLTLRHTSRHGERDDQLFDPVFFTSDGLQHDTSSKFDESAWLGAARLTWESLDGHLVQVAKATRNQTRRSDDAYDGTITDNLGVRETYSYASTYMLDTPAFAGARHYFTGYVEHDDESFTPNSDFGFFGKGDGVTRSRSLNAGAFEYRGEFADRLFVQGTVRHDDSSAVGEFNTWRTAASLRLPEIGLRPHASYGTGVKLPTMFENFGTIPGSYYPNPNLGPEESKGWDAGVETTLWPGRATIDVTYFDSDVTNKIKSFANCLPPFFSVCTSVNDPGVSPRKGIEVGGRFELGYGLRLGLAYTYTDARTPFGAQEVRRPQHAGRADIGYAFDGGRGLVAVSAEYVADNIDNNFATFPAAPVTLDPYWLVNVAASYKVQPGVEVFGRIENLLDQHYQEVYGFETASIAAYAGVRLTYEEPSTKDWVKYK